MAYAPLQLIEQMQSYFTIANAHQLESSVNKLALNWVENRTKQKDWSDRLIRDFVLSHTSHTGRVVWTKDMRKFWQGEYNDFSRVLAPMIYMESEEDFFNQMILSYIYADWRYHKLSYKVDPYMSKQFITMGRPDSILLDCVQKVPASCIYVDIDGKCEDICKNLEGIFIITSVTKTDIAVIMVSMVRGSNGRVMPIYTQSYINLDGFDGVTKCKLVDYNVEPRMIDMEDGVARYFNEYNLFTFYFNLMIYMSASNRDVEINPVSKKNVDKKVDRTVEPKNKFREVIEYQVGYKISSDLRKRYISSGKSTGKGSAKSSHFRSAHWHTYWTGHGDNKKRVIKWIEGVWVNGKAEQKVAVVHNIK